MILSKISGLNVKGRTFRYDLEPVTVLVGTSWSGKTAVLDAVRLGLMGHLPRLGKRPGDTFKLAKDEAMEISMSLERNGIVSQSIRHQWARENGSVKHTGPEVPMLSPLTDFREYLKLNGPARLQHLFKQITVKDFTDETVYAALRSIKPAEPSEDSEKATQECLDMAKGLAKARDDEDATIQDWLAGLISGLKEEKRGADAAVKQMTQLQQGATQFAAPAPNVDRELVELRAKLGVASVEKDRIDQEQKAITRRSERIAQLERIVKPIDETKLAALKERLVECEKAEAVESTLPAVREKIHVAWLELDAIKGSLSRAEEALEKGLTGFNEKVKFKKCPWCGSSKPGWQDILKAEWEEKRSALTKEIAKLKKQLVRAEPEYAKLMDRMRAAEAADIETGKLIREAARLRTEIEGLRVASDESAQLRAELKMLQSQNATQEPYAENRLVELRATIQSHTERIQESEQAQRRYIADKANEAQALKARAKQREQIARAEVLKLALAAVTDLQRSMIDRVINDLLGVANKFLLGITTFRLEYLDGEIGYLTDGTWVSHETFSGTEEALTYAAMSIAISQGAPLKLVMIDELGIADDATKQRIVQRMVALQKDGTIDQFIGADVSDAMYVTRHPITNKETPLSGVKVIQV